MAAEHALRHKILAYDQDGTDPTTFECLETLSSAGFKEFHKHNDYTQEGTSSLAWKIASGRLCDDICKALVFRIIKHPPLQIAVAVAWVAQSSYSSGYSQGMHFADHQLENAQDDINEAELTAARLRGSNKRLRMQRADWRRTTEESNGRTHAAIERYKTLEAQIAALQQENMELQRMYENNMENMLWRLRQAEACTASEEARRSKAENALAQANALLGILHTTSLSYIRATCDAKAVIGSLAQDLLNAIEAFPAHPFWLPPGALDAAIAAPSPACMVTEVGSNHSTTTAASPCGTPDSIAATFDISRTFTPPPPPDALGDDFDFGHNYHLPPGLLDDEVKLIETQTRDLTLGDLAVLGLTSDPSDPLAV